MRDRPLVLVVDEPTAALDAETEHALFERYAAAVREDEGTGRITILVSHRFSTGADGRPYRRFGRGARRGDGHARGADGARGDSTPSSTRFRPEHTAREASTQSGYGSNLFHRSRTMVRSCWNRDSVRNDFRKGSWRARNG
jgi:hypothetical protein